MEMLQRLRSFDAEQYQLEDLIVLHAEAKILTAAFEDLGMEVPEWLKDAGDSIRKAADLRARDQLEKELRETEGRIEALKSADEKRSDLKAKAERLKAKLAPKA